MNNKIYQSFVLDSQIASFILEVYDQTIRNIMSALMKERRIYLYSFYRQEIRKFNSIRYDPRKHSIILYPVLFLMWFPHCISGYWDQDTKSFFKNKQFEKKCGKYSIYGCFFLQWVHSFFDNLSFNIDIATSKFVAILSKINSINGFHHHHIIFARSF